MPIGIIQNHPGISLDPIHMRPCFPSKSDTIECLISRLISIRPALRRFCLYRVSDSQVLRLRCISRDFSKLVGQFSMKIHQDRLYLSMIKNINCHWKILVTCWRFNQFYMRIIAVRVFKECLKTLSAMIIVQIRLNIQQINDNFQQQFIFLIMVTYSLYLWIFIENWRVSFEKSPETQRSVITCESETR